MFLWYLVLKFIWNWLTYVHCVQSDPKRVHRKDSCKCRYVCIFKHISDRHQVPSVLLAVQVCWMLVQRHCRELVAAIPVISVASSATPMCCHGDMWIWNARNEIYWLKLIDLTTISTAESHGRMMFIQCEIWNIPRSSIYTSCIYLSKVLTGRFSILYKTQTKEDIRCYILTLVSVDINFTFSAKGRIQL